MVQQNYFQNLTKFLTKYCNRILSVYSKNIKTKIFKKKSTIDFCSIWLRAENSFMVTKVTNDSWAIGIYRRREIHSRLPWRVGRRARPRQSGEICGSPDWSSGFAVVGWRGWRVTGGMLNDVAISTSWKWLRSIERERETACFLLADKWRKAFATNYGTDTSSCGPTDIRLPSPWRSERKQLLLLPTSIYRWSAYILTSCLSK